MAELSSSGTYIIARARVWYDAKADTVHITSDDKDFGPRGVHVAPKKGSVSDANVRAALRKHGLPAERG